MVGLPLFVLYLMQSRNSVLLGNMQRNLYDASIQYRKIISEDGTIQLDFLPFAAGEKVQIVVLPAKEDLQDQPSNPLKGSVLKYIDPLEPVAVDDWEVLQ